MLNILVVGDFIRDPGHSEEIREFATAVGTEVIRQGHVLMNSCRNELDRIVAEGAQSQLTKDGNDSERRVVSYVMKSQDPVHRIGTVRQSRLDDWELGSPGLMIPEPVDLADAVIVIGGSHGTHRAANWARIAGKSLLPVARFAGAASEIYYQELDRFATTYAATIDRSVYENLADVSTSLDVLAGSVVSLAERVRASRSVFVVMSFSDDPDLEDSYDTFKTVCQSAGYSCSRVDDESNVPRIVPEILTRIASCAFVIIDITHPSVNVYYELGYAGALQKPVIVTAKDKTELPFDVKDVPVVFWKNQKGLREQLTRRIKAIAKTQGR